MESTLGAKGRSHVERAGKGDNWGGLYWIGEISAWVFLGMMLIPLALMVAAPMVPTTGGAAVLEFIVAHKAVYLVELICFVGLGLPAIAVFLALGVALSSRNRSLALLGSAMGVGSELIALGLGSSPPSLNFGLLALAGRYPGADAAMRLALAQAAETLATYANALSFAGIMTALGILILGIAMLKGGFPKATALISIATGASGIPLEALRDIVGPAYAVYGILLPIWAVAMALKLKRLVRKTGGTLEVRS